MHGLGVMAGTSTTAGGVPVAVWIVLAVSVVAVATGSVRLWRTYGWSLAPRTGRPVGRPVPVCAGLAAPQKSGVVAITLGSLAALAACVVGVVMVLATA